MTAPLVVILAGGEGRRIGGDKPLRMLGGERLIDRVLRLAQLWSDDVRLALRKPEQVPGIGFPILLDDAAIRGPLAGLRSALQAARDARRAFALTIPCDVPFLPPDLRTGLEKAIGTRLAAVAATGPDLHPTCALWHTEALDRLPFYLESGRRSLLGFAEAVGFARAQWASGRFFNVNSAKELVEAEHCLASEVEHLDGLPGVDRPGPRA
jgi:molybdopterin-guanine dinucleotide biosynthesis protein A